jgi:hypothetical protein
MVTDVQVFASTHAVSFGATRRIPQEPSAAAYGGFLACGFGPE